MMMMKEKKNAEEKVFFLWEAVHFRREGKDSFNIAQIVVPPRLHISPFFNLFYLLVITEKQMMWEGGAKNSLSLEKQKTSPTWQS